MEIRHLVSFLAIADELHFGRAAAKIHLAQPSLSAQLQRLEQSLGVQLVSRSSHEVRLTAAGNAFVGEARRVITQVEQAKEAARLAAAGRVGAINVGYNFPAGHYVLPATLAKLHAEFPEVAVSLYEKRTGPQLEALLDGDLDVAFVYGRSPMAQLNSQRVLPVQLVALVGRTHPWATRGCVSFGELANQRCILFRREQSPAMYDVILSAAERAGSTLDVIDEQDDPCATAITVATKPVVGFCSAPRATQMSVMPAAFGAVMIPLVDPVPTVDLHVVRRAERHEPMVHLFLQALRLAGPFAVPRTGRGQQGNALTRR